MKIIFGNDKIFFPPNMVFSFSVMLYSLWIYRLLSESYKYYKFFCDCISPIIAVLVLILIALPLFLIFYAFFSRCRFVPGSFSIALLSLSPLVLIAEFYLLFQDIYLSRFLFVLTIFLSIALFVFFKGLKRERSEKKRPLLFKSVFVALSVLLLIIPFSVFGLRVYLSCSRSITFFPNPEEKKYEQIDYKNIPAGFKVRNLVYADIILPEQLKLNYISCNDHSEFMDLRDCMISFFNERQDSDDRYTIIYNYPMAFCMFLMQSGADFDDIPIYRSEGNTYSGGWSLLYLMSKFYNDFEYNNVFFFSAGDYKGVVGIKDVDRDYGNDNEFKGTSYSISFYYKNCYRSASIFIFEGKNRNKEILSLLPIIIGSFRFRDNEPVPDTDSDTLDELLFFARKNFDTLLTPYQKYRFAERLFLYSSQMRYLSVRLLEESLSADMNNREASELLGYIREVGENFWCWKEKHGLK